MKNKNRLIIPFLGKKNNLKSELLYISLAIGASVGYYLFNRYGLKKTTTVKSNHINKLIPDERNEVKNLVEKKLGHINDSHEPIQIAVPEAGTLNWKKNREPSMFPPIPDSNIRIN